MLVWDLEGSSSMRWIGGRGWAYPLAAKFERLLPACARRSVAHESGGAVAGLRAARGVEQRAHVPGGRSGGRTSSHYTPKSLTSLIVGPLLRALGEAPRSDQLPAPAIGSGAFLVEACRFLADQVVAAWSRQGELKALHATTDDLVLHARCLVAQRCLYGVDLKPICGEPGPAHHVARDLGEGCPVHVLWTMRSGMRTRSWVDVGAAARVSLDAAGAARADQHCRGGGCKGLDPCTAPGKLT
jgi:hypothetical protein